MRIISLKRNDILLLLKKEGINKISTTSFFLIYKLSSELKLTISTCRKFGNAVVRNKIRRQIYNYIHQNQQYFKNIHLWFRIQPHHKDHTWPIIFENLKKITIKINL